MKRHVVHTVCQWILVDEPGCDSVDCIPTRSIDSRRLAAMKVLTIRMLVIVAIGLIMHYVGYTVGGGMGQDMVTAGAWVVGIGTPAGGLPIAYHAIMRNMPGCF